MKNFVELTFSKNFTINAHWVLGCFCIQISILEKLIPTFEDPIPGWCTNFFGLNGIIASVVLGFVRVGRKTKHFTYHVICADFVVNSTLAVIWNLSKSSNNSVNETTNNKPTIYTISSTGPTSVEVSSSFMPHLAANPYEKSLWLPSFTFCNYDWSTLLFKIMLELIPAILIDFWFFITKKKMRILPVYRKMRYFYAELNLFISTRWIMDAQNMYSIYDKMSEEDKSFFPMDYKSFVWQQYTKKYAYGVRTYLVKESTDLTAGKRKYKKIKLAHFCLKCAFYLIVFGLLVAIVKTYS